VGTTPVIFAVTSIVVAAILALVTAKSFILAVSTASVASLPAVTFKSFIFAVSTASVASFAAVTEPSEGSVINPTPLCTMKSFVEVDAIEVSKVMVAAEIV